MTPLTEQIIKHAMHGENPKPLPLGVCNEWDVSNAIHHARRELKKLNAAYTPIRKQYRDGELFVVFKLVPLTERL